MPSDIQMHRDERTIHIRVANDLNAQRTFALFDRIALAVKLYHGRHILVDVRDNAFHSDMAEMLEIASVCSKSLTGFQHKIAFLVSDTAKQVKMAGMLKTCMEVKGFDFQQFVDYDAAMQWLAR